MAKRNRELIAHDTTDGLYSDGLSHGAMVFFYGSPLLGFLIRALSVGRLAPACHAAGQLFFEPATIKK